jgi:Raf kinase inhibitor-like YbhB/YbcL family protein
VVGGASRDEKLRHHLLRPGRADRLGLLALAHREHPGECERVAEGAGSASGNLPAGALQTRTDFGGPGYGGPCPPQGDHPHRYLFTVFAVKSDKLDVKPDTSAAVVGFNLHFNTLAKAEIMGLFKR